MENEDIKNEGEKENKTQSRKWQLTINNPGEKGFTHDKIKEELEKFTSLVYWCMSDEIGEKGTFHTHVFMACSSAVRFTMLRRYFGIAHLIPCRGTSEENRDYVFKEGKWLKDKKRGTNLIDSHEEYGELPVERQGARNDLADLYDMIKNGMSNYEIMENNPDYIFNMEKVDKVRNIITENKYKDTRRLDLNVTYIYGATGTGKTRGVMDEYGDSNVFRVTDYQHPFDSYKNQDVVIFEEFRSSLKIQDMLNYLDVYPLELPSRYSNKIACYTKVYIITNIPFNKQYRDVQKEHPETFNAFKRRIHKIIERTHESTLMSDIVEVKGLDNPFQLSII